MVIRAQKGQYARHYWGHKIMPKSTTGGRTRNRRFAVSTIPVSFTGKTGPAFPHPFDVHGLEAGRLVAGGGKTGELESICMRFWEYSILSSVGTPAFRGENSNDFKNSKQEFYFSTT